MIVLTMYVGAGMADTRLDAARDVAVWRWGNVCGGQVKVDNAPLMDDYIAWSSWGHVTVDGKRQVGDCEITYDSNHDWEWWDLCRATAHEYGHFALDEGNAAHSSNPSSIMFGWTLEPWYFCGPDHMHPRTTGPSYSQAGGIALPALGTSKLATQCGGWCHQHTRVYTYAVDPAFPTQFQAQIERAAQQWSTRSAVLTLVRVNGAANITIYAVHNDDAIGRAFMYYHKPGHININLNRFSGSAVDYALAYPEQISCHELGHELGLGHGGDGCMSTNRDADQHEIRLAVDQTHPGASDVQLLDRTYVATGH